MTDRSRKVLAVLAEIASFLLAGGLAALLVCQVGDPSEPAPWTFAAVSVGFPAAVWLNWLAGRLRGGVE